MSYKKSGSILILSLLLLSILAISLAHAETAPESGADPITPPTKEVAKTALDDFGGFVKGLFAGDTINISDQSKTIISKLLLMILVVLLVYSVIDFVPIIKGDGIKWSIAGIVGILSFLFVSGDNIKYIVSNYEGLGIMLTSVLPFIIIIAFTMKLRSKNFAYASIINKFLLVGLAAYVAIKWATIKYTGPTPELVYLYPITLAGALIWMAIEKSIWYYKQRETTRATNDRARDVVLGAAQNQISNNLARKWEAGGALSPGEVAKLRAAGYDVSKWDTEE